MQYYHMISDKNYFILKNNIEDLKIIYPIMSGGTS